MVHACGTPDVLGAIRNIEKNRKKKNCYRYAWSNMQPKHQIGKEMKIWVLVICLKEMCAYRIREDDDSREIGDITCLKMQGEKYSQIT